MDLQMPAQLASAYRSRSQQTRVVSEAWGSKALYCANCDAAHLSPMPPNNRAIDFICPRCSLPYQLKGTSARIGNTINDGAYQAMLQAIYHDATPNLFLLRYDYPAWQVRDLELIPSFAFPESAIIKRRPLSAHARRHGWIGCLIDLRRIAPDARIPVVREQNVVPQSEVRAIYQKLKPIQNIKPLHRGWTLDVLNIVRRLKKTEFSNDDVYAFAKELERLHPGNRHIKDKIRQQLQVLRDLGFLQHTARASWAINTPRFL